MKELTQAAKCAKLIRAELKKAFPDTTFSVRSENFSMGNSVNISYTDGPSLKKVESLTQKYQMGDVDSMHDSYDYNNKQDYAQAKYVMVERHFSDTTERTLAQRIAAAENIPYVEDMGQMFTLRDDYVCFAQLVWRKYQNIDMGAM